MNGIKSKQLINKILYYIINENIILYYHYNNYIYLYIEK